MKRYIKQGITALILILGISGLAQAAMLKITATGSISNIFGFSDLTVVPFSVGDTFSYSVIVSDNPSLDLNPDPNITRQSYTSNFQANVAGSAEVSFGSSVLPSTNVSNTSLLAINDEVGYGDSVEIGSRTSGASLIDGIAPTGFSIKRVDFSGTALSSAEISPALFPYSGFADVNAVYLNMDANSGGCLSRRCAIGTINDITVETLVTTPVPAAVWLFSSGLLGLIGVARRRSVQS